MVLGLRGEAEGRPRGRPRGRLVGVVSHEVLISSPVRWVAHTLVSTHHPRWWRNKQVSADVIDHQGFPLPPPLTT